MKNKETKKKSQKLVYETESVTRWNMCLKLAKYAYRSTISDHQIEENIEFICDNFQPLKK